MEPTFYSACCKGDLNLVKELAPRVNLNWEHPSFSRQTALYVACEEGALEVVRFLLGQKGIDVSRGDEHGSTPLHVACWLGYVEVVRLLLADSRVDVNRLDQVGATPVYNAVLRCRTEVVSVMARDPRVDLGLADAGGETPLWRAVYHGSEDIIELLLASAKELNFDKRPTLCALESSLTVRELVQNQWRRAMWEGRYQRMEQLLTQFEEKPWTTIHALRSKLGWKETASAMLFAQAIFLCDGLLELSS